MGGVCPTCWMVFLIAGLAGCPAPKKEARQQLRTPPAASQGELPQSRAQVSAPLPKDQPAPLSKKTEPPKLDLDAKSEKQVAVLSNYAAAQLAGNQGDADKELLHMQAVVDADPSLTEIGLRLANQYLSLKQTDKAITCLQSLLEKNPEDTKIHLLFGWAWHEQGNTEKKRASFLRAIQCDPQNAMAHAMLYDLEKSEKNTGAALDRLKKRAGIHAAQSEFWQGVGEAYARILTETQKMSVRDIAREVSPLFCVSAELAPEDFQLLMRTAELLAIERKFDKAIALYERGLERQPENSDIRYKLALLYLDAGHKSKAIAIIENILKREPERHALYSVLAELYGQANERKKMVACLRQAQKHDADLSMLAEIAIRNKEWALAEEFLTKAAQKPTADVSVAIRRIQVLLIKNNAAQAKHAVLAARKRYPQSPLPILFQAMLARETQKNLKVASQFLDEAEALCQVPGMEQIRSEIFFERGILLDQGGDMQGAEKQFQATIVLNPKHHRAMNYLSYMWAEKNIRLNEALAWTQKALELDPDNGAYVDTLGWVYYRQGKYPQALEKILKSIAISGDEAELYMHLGDVYQKLNRQDAAIDAWKKSYAIQPDQKGLKERLLQHLPTTKKHAVDGAKNKR